MVIQSAMNLNEMMIMTIMSMLTLITIYYYLHMMYSALMLTNSEQKWNNLNFNMKNNFMMMLTIMTIMGLSFITLMMSIY